MDKFTEDLGELKEKFLSLVDIFKCPVCLEILHKDTISCVNGHSICSKCSGRQKVCPTCRADFSNVRQNAMVSQVLEVLSHKCKYENCSYMVNLRDDHEMYCRYRPIVCRDLDCLWMGPVNLLANHVAKAHGMQIFTGESHTLEFRDFDPDHVSMEVCLISAFGHYIWQARKYEPSNGMLTYTYTPVLIDKPSQDMLVKRFFGSRKVKYFITVRVSMNENLDHSKENSISIPSAVLHHFWDKVSKTIQSKYTITKASD